MVSQSIVDAVMGVAFPITVLTFAVISWISWMIMSFISWDYFSHTNPGSMGLTLKNLIKSLRFKSIKEIFSRSKLRNTKLEKQRKVMQILFKISIACIIMIFVSILAFISFYFITSS